MISPEEIRRKAENKYSAFLDAWLAGDEAGFFPCSIPSDKKHDRNPAVARQAFLNLKAHSKEVRGHGYTLQCESKKSRSYGRHPEVQKIYFETVEDFLVFIDKEREFALIEKAVTQIRRLFGDGELDDWIRGHKSDLIRVAPEIDGLLQVVECICQQHHLDRFARELPVSVDTKFVERNEWILSQWLNRVLPSHAIRADETHFCRRFGLRYDEPTLMIRFLDPELQQICGSIYPEYSVPLHSLAAQPIAARRVLIIENKVTLKRLPSLPATLGLGGLGDGVVNLQYIQWLNESELWYWGDIDVEGFQILSRLRMRLSKLTSIMMDEKTMLLWKDTLAIAGNGKSATPPANLTPSERAAFAVCAAGNLRIEQERLPWSHVSDSIASAFEVD